MQLRRTSMHLVRKPPEGLDEVNRVTEGTYAGHISFVWSEKTLRATYPLGR